MAATGYGAYEGYLRYTANEDASIDDQSKPTRAATVEVASVEMRTLSQTVEAVGTSRAKQSVEIVPETDGRIVELAITPGARAAKGAVLVRLDDTIARADLVEAEARLTEREQALSRITQLRRTNAVSVATLEEATARLAEARAQLDRARQRLAERTILAPFDGVVGLAEVDEGARVSAGTVITRLDDLSEVEVEFALPETLFAQIETGQTVTARSAAFPGQSFNGRIAAVDSRIDPVSRAFRARAVIPNPDGTLPSGMFMSLDLTISQAEHLVVPEEAIIFQAAQTYVFGLDGDTAHRIGVKTGARRDGMVAVLDGLEAGTQVVVRGLHRVRDGGKVKVLKDEDRNAQDEQGS
ncbi:efflux RND transporter periplasmic adaptor subunit [Roseovarius sp. A21]|uniref:Efflux RND transporter periplasmic adaptor subunit n=2 Tax=Roseovarius bejariae TaxID=2576383 RepID=A0A844CS67_9RHOB|nr:efflux RND transporter periplasmic adaptor subunit [Roseovarius bejariae]MRU14076.1 efflux RND transporter periplasmic adaptor subunit [Roseovarius bejariae]